MAEGWRYLASRLNGDGTERIIATDLPLSGVGISQPLSGVGSITATVPVEVARLKDSGGSTFTPWATAIYAEQHGQIRAAGIVTDAPLSDQSVSVSCVGFVGFIHGMPMPGELTAVEKDALIVARSFWSTVQGQPGANLGLELDIDPDRSPVLLGRMPPSKWGKFTIGKKTTAFPDAGAGIVVTWPAKGEEQERTMWGRATRTYRTSENNNVNIFRRRSDGLLVAETVEGGGVPSGHDLFGLVYTTTEPSEDGDGNALEPWAVTWWANHDLGQAWDDLADQGSFDYVEDHRWSGDTIEHTLRIGYPRIGRKRDDLRFAVGENVIQVPDVEVDGDEYTSEIVVLGAGEGRTMVRASWPVPNANRLARPKIYTDKTIGTKAAATKKAAQLAQAWVGDDDIKQLVVRDHPNAPIGSWSLGDVVTFLGPDKGWTAGRDMAVRILEQQFDPDSGDTVTLTVARADRVSYDSQQ